ncbi:hypothetical protein C480_15655 [Natrialba aegyptia DSM 13077]|uniref:Uncharacterized protein n=1 Tax=Natrialba aegyptia DSM 13077 TaxID=1227491 RepID=M0AZR4_9EURY|nr:hypothetical protein C480_15655 [Natrialba aegyptia DSM 13077]
MPTETVDSEDRILDRIRFGLQLGIGLAGIVFGVASLADIIEYQIPAVVWFAVSAVLFAYAAHLSRRP